MKFAFRVDSSPIIGMGHLMRCLTLANSLKTRGFECYFICRDFNGSGAKRVVENGFQLELLGADGLELDSTWLGVPFAQDAQDTIDVMSQNPVDWLIVDHYNIDKRWEMELDSKFPQTKIMVIDDLVDREHACDLLLDQTYGRSADQYQALVLKGTKFCLGTEFALLRDEFKELREQSKAQEKSNDDICHILVTLGGGDNGQPLHVIGKALKSIASDHLFSAAVITGNVPDELLLDYKAIEQNVELISFSNNIATEMAKADFVIGAGGGTSWERCCLGLPTVILTIADNQIEIARILNSSEAGIPVDIAVDAITSAVKTLLMDTPLRMKMSENAASLCDGEGAARVVREILMSSFEFRTATILDAQFIYDARYSDDASKFYRSKSIPSFESHVEWMESALAKSDRILTCISIGEEDVAHVRLDKNQSRLNAGDISICLAKEWRGKGVGRDVLNAANQYFVSLGFLNIHAEVHEDNAASASIFNQAGYSYLSTDSDGFMRYLWQA